MRILHVAPSLAARHGGPTEAILGMVRALGAEGVDARIMTTDDDLNSLSAVPLNRWTSYNDLATCFAHRWASRYHTLSGFTFAPRLLSLLWNEIPHYDLVHIHTVFSFPANVAMMIARKRKKPYAVRPMGHLSTWSLKIRHSVKQMQLTAFGRRNINGASFLHATSEMEAREARALKLRCPVKVVPLGVSIPALVEGARSRLRNRLGIRDSRKLILFLSRVHEKKGLEFLVRALAEPVAPSVDLVICGDGEPSYAASIRQLIQELGLTNRIYWLGFLRAPEKWEVAQGCDLFVLPSYSENFGMAVVEALACGLFVVVSPEVAIASYVSEPGIGRTVARDSAKLAYAIRECISDENFDSSARSVRRAFAELQFSWKTSARQLIAAYEEAIAIRSER